MTRHKRRKVIGIVKFCVLLTLPVAVAATFKGASGLKSVLSQTSGFSAEKTPSAAVSAENNEETSVISRDFSNEQDDILS